VAGIGAGAGIWLLVLLARDESLGGLGAKEVLAVVAAWSFIASGLIASRRGPRRGWACSWFGPVSPCS
jgi:hypothetical protein